MRAFFTMYDRMKQKVGGIFFATKAQRHKGPKDLRCQMSDLQVVFREEGRFVMIGYDLLGLSTVGLYVLNRTKS